jgi:hypothetical protein
LERSTRRNGSTPTAEASTRPSNACAGRITATWRCAATTEAKSRATLTAKVLAEARAGKDGGLPSAHALTFISECLFAMKNLPLVDAIDDALLEHGIPAQSVTHLLFVFTGNDADNGIYRDSPPPATEAER